MLNKKNLFWILVFFAFNGPILAAPSGADLLTACEDSLENGFKNERGMLCIWYVTPCDCHVGKKQDIPRVCLPPDISHEELATKVVKSLKEKPELKLMTAELAAATILAPDYPCLDYPSNSP